MRLDRREWLRLVAPVVGGVLMGGRLAWGLGGGSRWAGLAEELARIESESGGRLGVGVLDVATGETAGHRRGERFPMCSTSKAMAVSALLARVDAGRETLGRVVRFGRGELVGYSPVTETRVGAGMTLAELCAAAIT
ncbi:MAG: serine hydrolase, partial [Acidobacteriaceae bacterium]